MKTSNFYKDLIKKISDSRFSGKMNDNSFQLSNDELNNEILLILTDSNGIKFEFYNNKNKIYEDTILNKATLKPDKMMRIHNLPEDINKCLSGKLTKEKAIQLTRGL